MYLQHLVFCHTVTATCRYCAVTIPSADLRSLSLYYYTVCGRMCGTKHSGGPPEDGRKKTETCRGFILTNTFLTFYWF
jgi:hypothetical protein